ncbi:methylase [Aggregicoccus sp. 17bor-14]|uniref:methylase n=1 Tax=Myxococcaceae TaxID=31 RepID=UPI00129C635D|nr:MULTISPECIES: methylase [Myxococcaceae]MBF5044438.1 methylase [Simulacricoccus sp. 17bor-14]MRI90184.1 methylase [Aggregicoccus sp. 17bor-14]
MDGLDRKTRGRTSSERLRALDAYVVHCESALLTRTEGAWASAPFVDLGFGEHPWTTLESARAFRRLQPALRVVGVELEAARAEAAHAAHAAPLTEFRQGGFALPLAPGERARLVRALNVLRSYPAEHVPEAHRLLGEALLEGGLLVEGSADPTGSITGVHLLRREGGALRREALLLHTDFTHGFAPMLFRDWLPRDLRRRVRPGEPIHAFLGAWTEAWQGVRAGLAPPQAFRASALRLAERVEGVATDAWLLDGGYLRWQPAGGVPL